MANRIKGITVEIGGDTTKLQTALRGVNGEIKNTEAQLRDVNNLLKLDPGNTELIAQKHKLLGQAVDETKEKLAALKEAQKQADEALKNGTISQEQYDGLQREIVETEQKLKALEEQANQSATALQKIAATGEKLQDVGGRIEGVGKKLMPVSAAVTGIGVASVKTAADFESGMSKVAAISGAAGDDLDALSKKAREMGAKTKFSASEAASAMEYMAMAGWKTEDMLSGIEGVMNLAAASGEDLAATSDIVTDALTAFGLTAQDSGHFADVLAAASSNANTNVSMMGETFKYCAPIAGALGFSVEDTAEAIGLMANAGIKGSQAGTALRTIMNNLSGEVKICGENIGEVEIATTNADGSMRELSDILSDCRDAFAGLSESEKVAAAESLVGKNAMSGFLALMNAGEADINKLSGAIENCDGTAQKMADTMNDNLEGQLTILKSQLQELAISFGEILLQRIQKFVDVLNSLPDGVKETIVTIALIAAALGPVLIIVGKIITAVGTIMTIVPKVVGVINGVKAAFAALNMTMLANPIVLIIAAIAALVATFIYLWNTNEDFRQFWIDLWENVKEVAVAVWEFLKEFFTAAWEAIKGIAETVWNRIKDFFSGLWEGIKNIFSTVVEAIKTIITTYFEVYRTIIMTVLNAIQAVFTTIWNAIKTVVTTVVNGIKTTIMTVWNGIRNTVTSVMNAIKTGVSSAFNAVWNGIKNTVSGIYNTIKDGFNKAVDFIKGLASSAFSWGKDLVMGIVNGIKSCIGAVGDAVKSVADKIKSFLHFSVPDEGPLTDYESWMPDFMKGLAEGIEQSKGMVTKAMDSLAGDMVITPRMGEMAMAGGGAYAVGAGGFDVSALVSAIREGMSGVNGSGDIVIPVYLGGTMLDEVIVNAQQRSNLRSGGR